MGIEFLAYYLIVNVVGFFLYGLDKQKAIADAWRIPEKTLLLIAAIGGAYGALLGMRVFHHKTKKPIFRILVPLFAIIHIAIFINLAS